MQIIFIRLEYVYTNVNAKPNIKVKVKVNWKSWNVVSIPLKYLDFGKIEIPVLAKFYPDDRISITFLYNVNLARPYNFSYLQVFPI